ncbi:MAG: DeoR family transcriptional regulator [Actinophytocola sp.]|nr:DeoR family transcriptional regulator [Actinophytocola sp.]
MRRRVPAPVRERRDRIREHVTAAGHARIEDLVAEHGVSVMTVHRDLEALQRAGWLRKVRGGATAEPSMVFHGDVDHRMQVMVAAKREIARAAVRLLRPRQAVALDDSTTVFEVARLLAGHGQQLTVVTNFLPTMQLLAGASGIDLIGLGGTYYPAYGAFLGPQAVDAIRPLQMDVLLMSTTAITRGACFHQSQDTVAVKRALIEGAAQRVLLVDHGKFTQRGLHRLAAVGEFDSVIVDSGADDSAVRALRDAGTSVTVAGTGGTG